MDTHRFDCFGVVIELDGPGELHRMLPDHLPGMRATTAEAADVRLDVRERHGRNELLGYEVWRADGTLLTRSRHKDAVAEAIANQLHFEIASRSTDFVFVHAGVVAWNGWAIVLPGRSMSGKTTLVTALLRAGAGYYSDEYAIFDGDGLVHPYARRLRVRSDDGTAMNKDARTLTSQIGTAPIPLGMVAALRFEPGSELELEPISSGAAALALLDNTVRVRDEPASSVRAASSTGRAFSVTGVRGEADEAARLLIERATEKLSRR